MKKWWYKNVKISKFKNYLQKFDVDHCNLWRNNTLKKIQAVKYDDNALYTKVLSHHSSE